MDWLAVRHNSFCVIMIFLCWTPFRVLGVFPYYAQLVNSRARLRPTEYRIVTGVLSVVSSAPLDCIHIQTYYRRSHTNAHIFILYFCFHNSIRRGIARLLFTLAIPVDLVRRTQATSEPLYAFFCCSPRRGLSLMDIGLSEILERNALQHQLNTFEWGNSQIIKRDFEISLFLSIYLSGNLNTVCKIVQKSVNMCVHVTEPHVFVNAEL